LSVASHPSHENHVPELKFCGMTRPEDVAEAGRLAADYVGVIFAGGPRHQSLDGARRVLSTAATTRRVGVVSDQTVDEIAELVGALGLHAVQLHADPDPERIRAVHDATGVETWAVVRLAGSQLPPRFGEMVAAADAIVLDAWTPSGLGGSGVTLSWVELATVLTPWRRHRKLVLAGGLRAENVGDAIAALGPDVVDVSSGVESTPGVKDHERMRAFREAVERSGIGGVR
jgi:phosphoribosylanthranilate isomerase